LAAESSNSRRSLGASAAGVRSDRKWTIHSNLNLSLQKLGELPLASASTLLKEAGLSDMKSVAATNSGWNIPLQRSSKQ
jgi:hypothetical protein